MGKTKPPYPAAFKQLIVAGLSHPQAPLQSLTFHYGSHKPRISMVERLVGQSGWMQLSLLELDSFQHEEHLVFTAITDTGEVLDQESCEKLFYLLATTTELQASPARCAHCRLAETPAPRQPQPKPVCVALERGLMFLKLKFDDMSGD